MLTSCNYSKVFCSFFNNFWNNAYIHCKRFIVIYIDCIIFLLCKI